MAQYPIVQLTNKQRLMGTTNLFKFHGTNKWIKLGPAASTVFTPTLTEVDDRSNEWGDNRLIGKFVTGKDPVLVVNEMSQWTDFAYQTLFMAEKQYLTQEAVVSATMTVEDVAVGDVFRLPGVKGSITSITDGAESSPVSYAVNTNYIFNGRYRTGEFTKLPVGAGDDAVVTYSLPAITEADGLLDLEMMSASGARGEFLSLGIIPKSFSGSRQETEMWIPDIEFRPQGDVSQGDTANVNKFTLVGNIYSHPEHGYGRLRYIPQEA